MYRVLFLLLVSACTLPAEREAKEAAKKADTTTIIQSNEVSSAALDTSDTIALPPVQKVKKPTGIYQVLLSVNEKIEQTVLFNDNFTYKLQERYIGKDSVVIIEGNWTPSDGFVWLYKDQLVRGRYKWEGNRLQYYSPRLKKSFSMNHMQEALQNAAWRNKGKQGIVLFGVGNEPFWSVEYSKADTLSFLLAEWKDPVKFRVDSFFSAHDSLGYLAQKDSSRIRVTVFPQFCNDGMSDFTYRNRIKVTYNQHVYNGCGIIYR